MAPTLKKLSVQWRGCRSKIRYTVKSHIEMCTGCYGKRNRGHQNHTKSLEDLLEEVLLIDG